MLDNFKKNTFILIFLLALWIIKYFININWFVFNTIYCSTIGWDRTKQFIVILYISVPLPILLSASVCSLRSIVENRSSSLTCAAVSWQVSGSCGQAQ